MIYRLRRRFILISTVSVLSVVVLVFAAMLGFNISSTNRTMDVLADSVSEGGGKFPTYGAATLKPGGLPPGAEPGYHFITPETPFSTRHFTVYMNDRGMVLNTHTDAIYAISDEQAVEYAREALAGGKTRGWLSSYRYKVFSVPMGQGVVFVDGSVTRAMMFQSLTISGGVLLSCAALVMLLILLLSKRAVKPIAESYEKQKQFVTDANHELKTPLTLILANLDIAEEELGQNEWLEDIRFEGQRMAELVNQLVALSRMDEEGHRPELVPIRWSRIVEDTVREFAPLASSHGKTLTADVEQDITLRADEALLQRLMGILMDNAIKYCDPAGQIHVTLRRHRRVILTVENTCAAVGQMQLQRLFDRFYRGDKARTFTGGYGVGLSIAKAIVQQHRGEITAYQKGDDQIGFKVIL